MSKQTCAKLSKQVAIQGLVNGSTTHAVTSTAMQNSSSHEHSRGTLDRAPWKKKES